MRLPTPHLSPNPPSEAAKAAGKAMAGRGLIPRYGGLLFAAGATLGLFFVLILPAASERTDETGVYGTLLATYAVAALLLAAPRRIPLWAIQPVTASGILLISSGIYFLGDDSTAIAMFYFWPVLFAFYFFKPRQAIVQLALAAACYGGVLLAMAGTDGSLTRWIITTATLITAGALMGALKARITQLVGRLAEAVRTDPLTGLVNRRGFEELFELEMERARRHQRRLSVLMADLDHFKDVNDRFGHHAGDSALEHVSAVLKSAKRRIDTAARLGGEEFALIIPDTDENGAFMLAERLRNSVRQACVDEPVPLTISFGVASYPSHGDTAEGLLHSGDRALYAAKALGRNRSVIFSSEIVGAAYSGTHRANEGDARLATVLALAETLDIRDTGTARHSHTVGAYAEITAKALGLPSDVVERVRVAGILHDVGKIGVSDSVLRKPGPLTAEEWREMRKHPEIGARILENANLDDVREWVLCHQERPDGTGYPRGLEIKDIPLEARILAVADAYEAMTSDRVYRSALSHEAAQVELNRCVGSQFDQHVVDALLRALKAGGEDQVETAREEAGGNGSPPADDGETDDVRSASGGREAE